MNKTSTAVIQREQDMYVGICPELDIAGQGDTIQEGRSNLREAIKLFLEEADTTEMQERMHEEQYISSVDVGIG